MADNNNNVRTLGQSSDLRRTDELVIIGPWSRVVRRLKGFLWVVLVLLGFFVGVLAGTSGTYSDFVADVRRFLDVPLDSSSSLAEIFNKLARLDVTQGVDDTLTRQDIAASLKNVEGLCTARLDTLETSVGQRITSSLRNFDRIVVGLAGSLAESDGQIELKLGQLQNNLAEVAVYTQNTENFCALTYQQLNEILQPTDAASGD